MIFRMNRRCSRALSLSAVAICCVQARAQRAACRGALRDPSGTAIAGAAVTFCQDPSQTFGLAVDRVEITTDAEGAFAAELLAGSPYVGWAIGPVDVHGERWITSVCNLPCAGRQVDLVAVRRARPHRVTLRGVTPWRDHVPPALRLLVDGRHPLTFDRPLSGDGTFELMENKLSHQSNTGQVDELLPFLVGFRDYLFDAFDQRC